jgi:hypothetical protein
MHLRGKQLAISFKVAACLIQPERQPSVGQLAMFEVVEVAVW